MVMEYLPLGSLHSLIRSRRLTISDLIQMAKHTAAGMLHLEEKKMVHGDLALRNLLVGTFGDSGRYVVKISDFVCLFPHLT